MRSLAALAPFLLTLIFAGCDGSSSDDGGEPADDASGPVVLDGRIVDAVNGAPLGGATVGMEGSPGITSSSEGRFELGELNLSDAPFIRFALDGYREEFLARPSLDADPELGGVASDFDTVRLVPDDLAGEGDLAGVITGSDGLPVAGATLRFLRGLFVTDGEAVATTITDANGNWLAIGLPYGNYTCIILIPGQDPIYQIVQVFGGVTRADQDVSVPVSAVPPSEPDDPRTLRPGEIRIELDYSSFHEYGGELVFPDGTVITRESPEVNAGSDIRYGGLGSLGASGFTLPLDRAEGMIYRVQRDFAAPGSQISRNAIEVRVVGPDGILATFEPPERGRTGRWTVFRVENGEFVEILVEPEE